MSEYANEPMLQLPHDASLQECLDLLDDHYSGLFRGTGPGREQKQWLEHVQTLGIKTILEVGGERCRTSWLLSRMCEDNALIVTVEICPTLPLEFIEEAAQPGKRITVVRGDAHDPDTYKKVIRALGGRKLDMLFIDASHEYEDTMLELRMYHSLVKLGGHVSMHDVCLEHLGTYKAWQHITEAHPEAHVFHDPEGYGMGMFRYHGESLGEIPSSGE